MQQNPGEPRQGDSYVQSLARGLSTILAFGKEHPQLTLSEVAARAGLTRAGARRILLTLEKLGYVKQQGRLFSLTPKILDLGYSYLSATPLWNLSTPYMEEVATATHEACSISVLEGTEVVYILRIATHRIMTVNLSIGSRLPAWVTSMGRVLLAGLPTEKCREILSDSDLSPLTEHTVTDIEQLQDIITQTRQQGYAYVVQELEEGLHSIAVPIHDRDRNVIAAMNVSGHIARNSRDEMLNEFLPHLLVAARKISNTLARI
jgi:IclR family pca regulon transcriptional regulator